MEIGGTSSEQIANGKHVSLDTIDKLTESVERKLKILRPFSDQCSIYRVPKLLRDINEKAYTPQVISIGPIHHGTKELKGMEEHKKLYLWEFLELSMVSVKDFVAAIAKSETRLRNCYAETFENLSQEEFVEMMLFDCCFLIMFLLKLFFSDVRSSNIDRIFSKPMKCREIMLDLCMLENQIPFFIIEDMLKQSKILDHTEYSAIKLTHMFLCSAWSTSWVPDNILEQINASEVCHFVDFLRICQQPAAQQTQPPEKLATLTAPSIAELHDAGIKFKLGSSSNLLDIKFDDNKGILEIPQLKIADETEMLFRNLQAFEQCHYSDDIFLGNYFTMINVVVQATKDVEILIKKDIIYNLLRDNDAVLSLFHNLAKGNLVCYNKFYFSRVVKDLNKYCRMRTHKWKAALKHKYFHNPWTIVSVIAAAVLLILTVIQTVCSIIQVV